MTIKVLTRWYLRSRLTKWKIFCIKKDNRCDKRIADMEEINICFKWKEERPSGL